MGGSVRFARRFRRVAIKQQHAPNSGDDDDLVDALYGEHACEDGLAAAEEDAADTEDDILATFDDGVSPPFATSTQT